MGKGGLALLAAMLASGCTSTPSWISAPPAVVCSGGAESRCMGELVARNVIAEKDKRAQDRSFRLSTAVFKGMEIPEPAGLAQLRSKSDAVMCMKPITDFVDAGAAVSLARQKQYKLALADALKVPDEEARLFALSQIAALASRAEDENATATLLTSLNEQDTAAYMDALQHRLLTLLARGDLERAQALRNELVDFYVQRPGSTMAVAQIAVSYLVTGHIEDANAFLRRVAVKIPGLKTQDMATYFAIIIKASKGDLPDHQDFLSFSSDAVRLEAYVQLAVLFERTGQTQLRDRVASDMARFSQKSSFNVSGSDAMKAFAKVLIEAM